METEIVTKQYHEGLLRGLSIAKMYAEAGKSLTPEKLDYEIAEVSKFRIKEDLPLPKADEKRLETRIKTAETKELNLQMAQAIDLGMKLNSVLTSLPIVKNQVTINADDIKESLILLSKKSE